MSDEPEFDAQLLAIYGELSRDELTRLVVRYASRRLNAGGSSIFLRDSITGRYVLRGTTGLLNGSDMPVQRVEYELGEGMTGWIAKHGRSLLIPDPSDTEALRRVADDLVWSRKYSEASDKPGLDYLGVPILSRDGTVVLGVLRVSGKARGEQFNKQDEQILGNIAAMVNIAIENSQRYEREKRRARYFRLLLEVSNELNPRRPIAELLGTIAGKLQSGFRTEACLVYLRSEEDVHQAALRAASGLPRELVGKVSYSVDEGATGHILRTGRPVQIRLESAFARWHDQHIATIAAHLPSRKFRSFVGVPLRAGDETVGALELVNKIPSSPGHRDWFTDDDEGYLLLLSAPIGGVLEGARYLKALNDVGVTAMRMQRVASFGTLAQRIRHEASNPLAVARLASSNLRGDLRQILAGLQTGEGVDSLSPERIRAVVRRLDVIEASLDETGGKLLDLLKFSQRIGFTHRLSKWNDVVREVLIWLAAERQRRSIELHVRYGELPQLFVEPNELFGVLVTMLRLAMEGVGEAGGLVEVGTSLSADRRYVRTLVAAPSAPCRGRVEAILEPDKGSAEELSPIHFEWGLAAETVDGKYGGSLSWRTDAAGAGIVLTLDLPVHG
jgi:GAF domain-containing protein